MTPDEVRAASEALTAAAKRVRVLGRISWSETVVEEFLASWRKGDPVLPVVEPNLEELSDTRGVFSDIAGSVDAGDPVGAYLHRSATSYETAVRMIEAAGTPAFTAYSTELYGRPDEQVVGAPHTHADLAARLLGVTDALRASAAGEDHLVCLTAHHVRDEIQSRVDEMFGAGEIPVVVDDNLASKAAASVSRIRIRGRTCFSEADIDQLVEHEAFIHVATARNGMQQPHLSALGLGSPRTTGTQEGLATLAELITGSIDLSRLRRIALRIQAVAMGLEGADFLEIFKFFLDQGQSDDESARSAARVFRGGDPRGRVVFTKDISYLYGLVSVHTFFRRAIADARVDLVNRVFAGRLTLGDVLALEERFDDGFIEAPRYVPEWAADPRRLAAYLSFSVAVNQIDLSSVRLEDLR